MVKGNRKGTSMWVNSRTGNNMVRENTLILMETSFLENTRMTMKTVKELLLGLMETNMWVNSRTVNNMVKEHILNLREGNM